MKIAPRDASERDVRPARNARLKAPRASATRAGRPAVEVDAESVLPRSIARSQAVVAGLEQLRSGLERRESIDLGSLIAAVRFEGEPVLGPREKELQEIVRTRDTRRLARLIETTENNALALLSRSGIDVPQTLLSAAGNPQEMRLLLEKTLSALASRRAEVSALRPERVIELLR